MMPRTAMVFVNDDKALSEEEKNIQARELGLRP